MPTSLQSKTGISCETPSLMSMRLTLFSLYLLRPLDSLTSRLVRKENETSVQRTHELQCKPWTATISNVSSAQNGRNFHQVSSLSFAEKLNAMLGDVHFLTCEDIGRPCL